MRIQRAARIAPFAAFLMLAAGCLQSDRGTDGESPTLAPQAGESWVEGWNSVGPPALPSLEELRTELGLTEEQSGVVEAALGTWQAGMEVCSDRIRDRARDRLHDGRGGPPPGGHGMPGGFGEFEPPMLGFLESVVPVLEPGQVSTLADLLEARCNERPRFREGRGGRHGHGPGPGPGMFLGPILQQIEGVTAEQGAQIREALEGMRQEFFELRRAFAAGTVSAEDLRDRAKELRESIEAALREILTAEQYAAFEEAVAEHRADMAERRLENLEEGVARRLEFLGNVLGLSDAQKAQVAAVLDESIAARRTVLEALRDGSIEIEDALYQGYVIARETADAIRALLDPEQVEIFDSLKRLLPGHRGP